MRNRPRRRLEARSRGLNERGCGALAGGLCVQKGPEQGRRRSGARGGGGYVEADGAAREGAPGAPCGARGRQEGQTCRSRRRVEQEASTRGRVSDEQGERATRGVGTIRDPRYTAREATGTDARGGGEAFAQAGQLGRGLGSWAVGWLLSSRLSSARLISRPGRSSAARAASNEVALVQWPLRGVLNQRGGGRRGGRPCLSTAEGCTVASPRAPHPHHAGRYAHSSDHREGWWKDQSTTLHAPARCPAANLWRRACAR